MDAITCIKTRRSIRKFKPKPVPRELLNEVLDCARHAPSACDGEPWLFVIVKDRKQKQELSTLKKPHPSHWMVDAPVLVGVCVDLSKSPRRWIADGAIAAENMLLAAHALGLGACWIAMRYDDSPLSAKIQKALGVGENIFPICLIALGYPDEEPHPKELHNLQSMVR
ncbi:MAG: nitroreductase family protein [Candidatus Diapherotrites archaeon]|nr:nitroreductase family protein [Candidatus Diapherotrites archaeon]